MLTKRVAISSFPYISMNPIPLDKRKNSWMVWGIPISAGWWQSQPSSLAHTLCLDEQNNGAWFAALVAAAFECLSSWSRSGLEIKGRTWVDVGGGYGHFSIALKLFDAENVTMIDPRKPNKWTLPVCKATGVQVITADGNKTVIQDSDSALLLNVPDVKLRKVFLNHPGLTQMVTDDTWFLERWLTEIGWQERLLTLQRPVFVLGDDCAVLNDHARQYTSCESLLYGLPVARPVPDLVFENFDIGPRGEQENEDDEFSSSDPGDVPF